MTPEKVKEVIERLEKKMPRVELLTSSEAIEIKEALQFMLGMIERANRKGMSRILDKVGQLKDMPIGMRGLAFSKNQEFSQSLTDYLWGKEGAK